MQLIPIYHRPGLFAACDDEDFDVLRTFRWTLTRGYARRWTGAGYEQMAWSVARLAGLVIPHDHELDHADRDRLNNCRSNIRVITRGPNNANRTFYDRHLRFALEPYVAPN